MINEIILMNGYGIYVWSAFSFTLISFAVLYSVIKVQLVKEKVKFNAKFSNLTVEKKQTVKAQETYREILAEIANSDLLSDILSEIAGKYVPVTKHSTDLAKDILNSEYMLS